MDSHPIPYYDTMKIKFFITISDYKEGYGRLTIFYVIYKKIKI